MGVVLSEEQGVMNPYTIIRCDKKSMFIIESNDGGCLDFVKIETDGAIEDAESVSFDDQLAEEQCVG